LRGFGAFGGIRSITLPGKLAWQGPVAKKAAHCADETAAKRMRRVVRGRIGELNSFGYAGHQMLGFSEPDNDVPPARCRLPKGTGPPGRQQCDRWLGALTCYVTCYVSERKLPAAMSISISSARNAGLPEHAAASSGIRLPQ
jgi:hypothetical protein